jgi:hypothetical protein
MYGKADVFRPRGNFLSIGFNSCTARGSLLAAAAVSMVDIHQ